MNFYSTSVTAGAILRLRELSLGNEVEQTTLIFFKDDIFIDSGPQFLASVTISESASIGVGPTIITSAHDHRLTLSRADYNTVAG